MPFFTSSREKYRWFWAFLIFATIISTLFMGQPLANQLRDQNIQAIFFLSGMVLIATAVIIHGLKNKPGKVEFSVLIGILAVYVMFFFRLGAPERSHLIEYSVLTIFIHNALTERFRFGNQIKPVWLTFLITFGIGVLDESIQQLLPDRVFDWEDILFNGIAVMMALGSTLILRWVRRLISKSRNPKKV